MLMELKNWYQNHKIVVFLVLFVAILLVIISGLLIMPEVFYDQWIWKYYWGPVVADAQGYAATWNGVVAYEGYTLVSEITYGIILVIALYGIYMILKRLNISIDWGFCLALMPYILFGPVTRVLEDTEYFHEPFVYWFISPLIYLQIAVYALGFIFLGYFLKRLVERRGEKQVVIYILLLFILVDIFYSLIWIADVDYGAYIIHPVVFTLLSLLAFLPILYRYGRKKEFTINTLLFSGGLLFFLPTIYLIGRWIIGEQWGLTQGVRFDVFVLITGLTAIITFTVFLVSRRYQENKNIAVYQHPLNLAMIVGHLIDGLTSYVSIYDPLNMGLPSYLEKHPASNFLMEVWPPLFPIVKFLLIVFVIYLFDVLYKKELGKYSRLVNLLKIGILILGFAPGLRDLLRVAMGV